MKRFFFLLSLTALATMFTSCGAPKGVPVTDKQTWEPPAIVTQMPDPRHIVTVSDVSTMPPYIPHLSFEPESIWFCESFGYGGAAVAYVGTTEEGLSRMKIYMYDSLPFSGEAPKFWNGILEIVIGYAADTFSLLCGESTCTFKSLNGSVCVTDRKMDLSYSGAELDWTYASEDESYKLHLNGDTPCIEFFDTGISERNYKHYLPVHFTLLTDMKQDRAIYKMPLFCQEIEDSFRNTGTMSQLIETYGQLLNTEQDNDMPRFYRFIFDNTEIHAELMQTNTDENSYYIWNLCSYSANTDIEVRTLGVGSQLESVLAALGIGDGREITIPAENEVIYLYDGITVQCRLERHTGEPLKLWAFDGNIGLIYSFDENNCVFCVEYRDAGY